MRNCYVFGGVWTFFLFRSPIGESLLRWMSEERKTVLREEKKLIPIIERVQQGIEEKLGLASIPIQLRVADELMPNALALSRET